MPNLFTLTASQFETFLLIFVRISTMLLIFPAFGAPQIPPQVRFGLSAVISFMIFRLVPMVPMSHGIYGLLIGVVSQIALGMIVGFVASLVFVGIQFAGELIDLMIGFAVANVINPTTQQSITIIGEFELALATLLFFITNSHYLLLQGIANSFTLVPLPFINLDPSVAGNVVLFLSQAFTIVFRIAAPVAVALFLANIMFAFMARVAPQMNVLVIGLPIQIGVGLIMIGITMPLLGNVAPELFAHVASEMNTVMQGLRAH